MKRALPLLLIAVIVITFIPSAPSAQAPSPHMVRVGLLFNNPAISSVEIQAPAGVSIQSMDGTQLFQNASSTTVALRQAPAGGINAEVNGSVVASAPSEISLRPISGHLSFNNISYRGHINVSRINGGSLNVINVVEVNDYVRGVIGPEIGPGAPLEAQKAQAVAARTYAANNVGRHAAHGFDVCILTHCQVYGGIPRETAQINRAVDETFNTVGVINGRMVSMVYFASTGGRTAFVEHGWTENAENVWGFAHPHLVARPSPNETPPNWYHWTHTTTPAQLTTLLAHHNLGTITDIEILSHTPRGVVTRLRVVGTDGEREFLREAARTFLGATALRSQAYTLETVRDSAGRAQSFTFYGRGWGHQVGMSQEGAMAMARRGANYREILTHYYTGLTFSQLVSTPPVVTPTPPPVTNLYVIDAAGNRTAVGSENIQVITENNIRQTLSATRFWIRSTLGLQEITR